MCDPDSGEARGAIQLIMTNVGHSPSVVIQNMQPSADDILKGRRT